MKTASPGASFKAALTEEKPLQVVGAVTEYAARLAERTGFRALYVSGGGVAEDLLVQDREGYHEKDG